jgi:hypothetical protein
MVLSPSGNCRRDEVLRDDLRMGRFTAPGTSLARGYIDDGTPSGRRFVFELPGDGWPPRTVDLPDPPGSATPGRVRRYRSVGRRRGYVYLYVFEEMPGVYPGADPVDPPTEPALPVVPDVPDGPGPDDGPRRKQQVITAVYAREDVERRAARRRKAARRREIERRRAEGEQGAELRVAVVTTRRAAGRAAARRAAAGGAAARRGAAGRAAARGAAAGRVAARQAGDRRAAAQRVAAERAAARRVMALRAVSRRSEANARAAAGHVAVLQRELAAIKAEVQQLRAALTVAQRPDRQETARQQAAQQRIAARQEAARRQPVAPEQVAAQRVAAQQAALRQAQVAAWA